MPSLRLGIWATVTYAALIAAASFYVFQIAEGPFDARGVLAALFPTQLIVVIFCCMVVLRYYGWQAAGFGRFNWMGLIWLLPSCVVLGVMAQSIAAQLTIEDLRGLGRFGVLLLVGTTFLIAFGEEVLFRGILLRGAMQQLRLPLAMMMSAVLFGAFHLVNGIAGQGFAVTSHQVMFAVFVGFFLAPVAVRVNNLWPLIIWHWLWNICVFLSQLADLLHPFVLIGIAMQTVISLWLWADITRHAAAN